MSGKGGQCSHLTQFLVEVKVPPVQGVTVEGSGWGQRHLAAIRDDVMSTPTKAKHNMSAHSHVHINFKVWVHPWPVTLMSLYHAVFTRVLWSPLYP